MVANFEKPDRDSTFEQLDRIFQLQKSGFASSPFPDAMERISNLNLLKTLMLDNKERIADAIYADFGCRSRSETMMVEMLVAVEGVKYATKRLRRWMRPSRRHVGLLFKTTSAKVVYQPKGVVGILVPWNYPLFLAMGPAIYALAAGNRVMIKMSEATPQTGALLEELISSVFPEQVMAVVNGGADVAAAFSAKPFDHILFTGSTNVGRLVMQAAAKNLTPVTLELGGKSPTIIGPECDLEMAAERLAFTKALNAGQTCVAPDYVMVQEGRQQEFVAALTRVFSGLYRTLAENDDYTSIINDSQYQRLSALLDDAREKGAQLIEVNPGGEKLDPAKRKLPLVLVLGAKDSMRLMQEEIFGPILPVIAYRDLESAIQFVNSRPRPLALYYFGNDENARRQVLERTHSGGVCFNDAIFHVAVDDMPFGGIGPSGMGAYHGHEGFLTFSHAKGVLSRPRWLNTSALLHPPYGGRLQALVERLFLR
ncbi:MAG: coniferyl aldehyde dehydrogenase [Gammaproteobacteria bacterium]|jgi:coniferyl-aldehyde dehydrogenase|nr:coniferyl aldehyde dehydrogenase [Gammaproteobacteria bacterium]